MILAALLGALRWGSIWSISLARVTSSPSSISKRTSPYTSLMALRLLGHSSLHLVLLEDRFDPVSFGSGGRMVFLVQFLAQSDSSQLEVAVDHEDFVRIDAVLPEVVHLANRARIAEQKSMAFFVS